MGRALSEASGRFAHRMSRHERRKLLDPGEMPARDKVAAVVRDTDADPDAEFTADFTGMLDLIEAAATKRARCEPPIARGAAS
jgi:hypothetical protein